jgi:hypothetical protein
MAIVIVPTGARLLAPVLAPWRDALELVAPFDGTQVQAAARRCP